MMIFSKLAETFSYECQYRLARLKQPLLWSCLSLPCLLGAAESSEQSVDNIDPQQLEKTFLEQYKPDLSVGPVTFGGALRGNIMATNYDDQLTDPENVLFDTLMGSASLDYEGWDGNTQFRYYNSDGNESAFFHDGWLGYRWDKAQQSVKVGITKVPFGVLPFASNNYFFSLAYYVGLEDDYDVGAVYNLEHGPWSFKAGYFIREEWNGFGQSMDSARYSYDVVRSPNSANQERNQFNLWAQRTVELENGVTLSPGASLMYKMIPNDITDQNGGMWAAAIHTQVDYGAFNLKLEYSHYRYDLKNPGYQSQDIVVMGAYDAPYNVATEGDILVASASYQVPVHNRLIRSVTFYNDYSAILKSHDGYHASQQNVTGAFLDMDPILIYVDFALAQNAPFIGPNYGNALAQGIDDSWRFRFNINCGIYF